MLIQAFPRLPFPPVPSVIYYYYHDQALTQSASYIGFLLIDADDKRHALDRPPLSQIEPVEGGGEGPERGMFGVFMG